MLSQISGILQIYKYTVMKYTLGLRKHYSSVSIPKIISSPNNNIKNHLSGNRTIYVCTNLQITKQTTKSRKDLYKAGVYSIFFQKSLTSPLFQQIDDRLLVLT